MSGREMGQERLHFIKMLTSAVTIWAGWTAALAAGEFHHRRQVARIPHRILVWGMRGKSSAVRLLHAGFLGEGRCVFSRITGDELIHLLPDGSEEKCRRHGPANIREMRRAIRRAAGLRCDTICIENMAIDPALALLASSRVVLPTIYLYCFDGLDHTEVYPSDPAERAETIVGTWPKNGHIVLPDSDRNRYLISAAERHGRSVILAPSCNDPALRPFAQRLVGAVLKVLELSACRGRYGESVTAKARELQHFTVYQLGRQPVLDLLSANDPDSVREILLLLEAEGRLQRPYQLLYLHRSDRPGRLIAFDELLREFPSALAGDPIPLLYRRKVKHALEADLERRLKETATPLVLVGNRHGSGEGVLKRILRTAGSEKW